MAGFLLVSLLVTVMFLGLVQVAVIVHVRSVLIDCAAEGARLASRADRGLPDGEARTRELITASLSVDYARDVAGAYVTEVGSSRVDLQACKLEYSIVSPK